MKVQVTNRNPFPLTGRYDGKNYLFPPGVPVAVPEEAANHIFALDQDRAARAGAMNRLGLLNSRRSYDEAEKFFRQFIFATGRVVFESPEPDEPTPQPDKDDEDEEEPDKEQIGDDVQQAPTLAPGRESEAEDNPSPSASADLEEKAVRYKRAKADALLLRRAARGL